VQPDVLQSDTGSGVRSPYSSDIFSAGSDRAAGSYLVTIRVGVYT